MARARKKATPKKSEANKEEVSMSADENNEPTNVDDVTEQPVPEGESGDEQVSETPAPVDAADDAPDAPVALPGDDDLTDAEIKRAEEDEAFALNEAIKVYNTQLDKYAALADTKRRIIRPSDLRAMATLLKDIVERLVKNPEKDMIDEMFDFVKAHQNGIMSERSALRGVSDLGSPSAARVETVIMMIICAVNGNTLRADKKAFCDNFSKMAGAQPENLFDAIDRRAKGRKANG